MKQNNMKQNNGSNRRPGHLGRVAAVLTALCVLTVIVFGSVSCSSGDNAADEGISQSGKTIPGPAQQVVFRVGSEFFVSGPDGEPARTLATAAQEIVGPCVLREPGEVTVMYPTVESESSDFGASVRALDLVSGDDMLLAGDVLAAVAWGPADELSILTESEQGYELQALNVATGESSTIATSVADVIGGPTAEHLAFTTIGPSGTDDVLTGLYVTVPGQDMASVRTVEASESITLIAMTESKMVFSVTPHGGIRNGVVYAYDLETATLGRVADDAEVLDIDPDTGNLLLATYSDMEDAADVQPAVASQSTSGQWELVSIGTSVTSEGASGVFSDDGTAVLIIEGTFGEADQLQLFATANGDVLHESTLDAGVAVVSYLMTPDAAGLFLVTQEGQDSMEIECESLLYLEFAHGETVEVASSDMSQGEGILEIVDVSGVEFP